MCSAQSIGRGDLTSRAAIRDEALRLFAAHGPEAVSLRRVAAEAGVSPGLVAHHFGSKAGLRQAVDAHVAALFDGLFDTLFTALHEADWDSPAMAGSFAEMLLRQLPADSPVPAYLRRLLLSDDGTGRALFARWFSLTEQMLDRLAAAGHIAAAAIASALLALTFAAVAFAVGAATGNRPAALGAASALAVAGYVLEGLAQQIHVLHPIGAVNPWHWLLADDPLRHGLTWHTWIPPVAAIAVLTVLSLPRFTRRDLH